MWHILEEEIYSQVSDNSQKEFKLKMIEKNTYCPMKQLDTFNFNKMGMENSIFLFLNIVYPLRIMLLKK